MHFALSVFLLHFILAKLCTIAFLYYFGIYVFSVTYMDIYYHTTHLTSAFNVTAYFLMSIHNICTL